MTRVRSTLRRPLIALTVSFVAISASFGALAYTAASNANRANEIQQSRYDASLRSCESRNEDHRNIATRVQPRPPYTVADLERDFQPIATDCERYAREQIRTP